MSSENLQPSSGHQISGSMAALAGLLAGAAALSAGEVAGAIAAPRPGPVTAISNRVVDEAPTWFVNFGKSVFNLADKPALLLGTCILALLLAALLGYLSRATAVPGVIGLCGFGILGLIGTASDAQAGIISAAIINIIAVAAGITVLTVLLSSARRAESLAQTPAETAETPIEMPTNPHVARRSFLGLSATIGAGSMLGGLASRSLRNRSSAAEARDAVEIVQPETAAIVEEKVIKATTGDVASTEGITPLVISGEDFYRIDTALLVPQIDPADWSLTISGMVDNELRFSYQDLLDRADTVEPVTLSCVSNEVGGDLVGNAVWQGIPLHQLLDEAGVQAGATQISSRSVDGWTCGFPTEAAYDGRTALVAVAMNGEPLPIIHGFPVRLVVSGLYGYVSATKWLSEIEMTTIEDFDGYWIPRGWSKSGPVKTQSRIDTPSNFATLAAGTPTAIAGVAWAPNTGISKVEVQVDDQPWLQATLGESLGANAWRQWLVSWTPTAGTHSIQVRATDNSGYTQTAERKAVAPDGAQGWHTITVRV